MAVLGPLSSLLFSRGHLLFFSGKVEAGGETVERRQITKSLLAKQKTLDSCGGGEEREYSM